MWEQIPAAWLPQSLRKASFLQNPAGRYGSIMMRRAQVINERGIRLISRRRSNADSPFCDAGKGSAPYFVYHPHRHYSLFCCQFSKVAQESNVLQAVEEEEEKNLHGIVMATRSSEGSVRPPTAKSRGSMSPLWSARSPLKTPPRSSPCGRLGVEIINIRMKGNVRLIGIYSKRLEAP